MSKCGEKKLNDRITDLFGGPLGKDKDGKAISETSTAFGELIWRSHQLSFSDAIRYQFPNRQLGEEFLGHFMQNSACILPGVSQLGLRGELDRAYDTFAKEHAFEHVDKGGAYILGYSPIAGKLYGSATLNSFSGYFGQKATDTLTSNLPMSWREPLLNAAGYGVGFYGEAGGSINFSLGESYQSVDTAQAQLLNDTYPSAPSTVFIGAELNWRVLGAVSIGHWAPFARLNDGSFSFNAGIIYDRHGNLTQGYNDVRLRYSDIDHSQTALFRDGRINFAYTNGDGSPLTTKQVTGLQALYSRLPMKSTTVIYQNYWDRDDSWWHSNTRVDTLMKVYKGDLESSGPGARLPKLRKQEHAELFTLDWETEARGTYEQQFNHGKPLSNEQWNRILAEKFNPGWGHTLARQVDFSGMSNWEDKYIGSKRKAVYNDWEGIFKQEIDNRRDALKKMSENQLYAQYDTNGLKYPSIRIGIIEGTETQTTWGGGMSRLNPSASPSKWSTYGLIQLRHTSSDKQQSQSARYTIKHEAYEKFIDILKDPVSNHGIRALMNAYAYPRTTPDSTHDNPKVMDITPVAALLYDGTTPTTVIEGIIKKSGYRPDFSKIPGIYQVGQNDRTFDDIGRNALERLLRRKVSDQEARIYGQHVKRLNFSNLSEEEVQRRVFPDAYVILPGPYFARDIPGLH